MSAPRKRRKPPASQPESGAEAAPHATNGAHLEDRPANGNANGHDITLAEAQAEPPMEEEAGGDRSAEFETDPSVLQAQSDRRVLKQAIESLIFVSDRVVTAAQLGRSVKARAALVRELVAELMDDYASRGIELVEVGNGYQFRSAPACAAYVREFVAQKPVRLTRAQLETLALIAYRQPITRPEIDEIRGVDSGSAMRVLLERNLIKMLGRKDEPGRPLLYGTAPEFLEFFGMRSLKELPTLREFTELNEENRALFKRKTGEEVAGAEAELAAAEEAARIDDDAASAHVSDEDLAALAAEADAAELDTPGAESGAAVAGARGHVVATDDIVDGSPDAEDEIADRAIDREV